MKLRSHFRSISMTSVLALAAVSSLATLSTGCAVVRDQQSVGSYLDDTGITTAVKAKFADDPTVSAMAISVETLKGVVQLSGFAKSPAEKQQAETLARNTKGVTGVRNDIVIKP